MGGSSLAQQPGVYGTLGTPSVANLPGARENEVSWTDAGGHLWLFGGDGMIGVNEGRLNDLWEFDPISNLWTWMGGSNTLNQSGVSGLLGTPAAANIPGSRNIAMSWRDGSGRFWLFGGFGYDDAGNSDFLNDLWVYQPGIANTTATTTTLSALPNPSTFGGTVTLTATVSSTAGTPANGESIQFLNGTTTLERRRRRAARPPSAPPNCRSAQTLSPRSMPAIRASPPAHRMPSARW